MRSDLHRRVAGRHGATRTTSLVTASVISHGEADKLAPCLRSLAAQGLGDELRVTVVCNRRGDGSAELVRAEFPWARVIERPEPRGFGENHNAGLARSRSRFGLVLNPDVVLEPGCLRSLVALMESRPRCAIAAPVLSYPDGSPQTSARRFPEPLGTLVRRTPLRLVLPPARVAPWHYLDVPRAPRPIDWAFGAFLFVRRAAWEELGGFDERFWLYLEDIDVAWRAWQAGWEVWQTPDARAMHEHQAVIDRTFFSHRTMWYLRGALHFVRKHPEVMVGIRPRAADWLAAEARLPGAANGNARRGGEFSAASEVEALGGALRVSAGSEAR